MVRVESIGLCRSIDVLSGNGDRGQAPAYDPAARPEGCGVTRSVFGDRFWYWHKLASQGHRFWRVLAHRTNGNVEPIVSASEVDFHATVGGPNLVDGTGTAIASSQYDGGFAAANAFDGASSAWASVSSNAGDLNQWIGYDFGASRTVDVKEVVWHSRVDCCQFQSIGSGEVQWSDDGQSWTSTFGFVVDPISSVGQVSTISESPVPAADAHRYWRINGQAINDGYMRSSEIEMRETSGGLNVARYGVPFASSYYSNGYAPYFAFDGTTGGAHWATSGGLGWIAIDMLVPRSINEFRYGSAEGSKAPTSFGIEWSDDKVNWTESWHVNYAAWGNTELRTFARPDNSPLPPSNVIATSIVIKGGLVDSCIQVGELEVASSGVNVAASSKGGVATGTPGYGTSPISANDGVKPAGYPQIFHSGCGGGDYLKIDFANPSPIDTITLYGRGDCCQNRDLYSYELFNGSVSVGTGTIDARAGSGSVQIGPPRPTPVPTVGTAYNMKTGFSMDANDNPFGIWSYTQDGTPMTVKGGCSIGDCVRTSAGFEPAVANTNQTGQVSSTLYSSARLHMHPGASSDVKVRFRAPTTGWYHVVGLFEIADTNPSGINVNWGQGAVRMDSSTRTLAFDYYRQMTLGDYLAFSVNNAGNYSNDSTGLRGSVTYVGDTDPTDPGGGCGVRSCGGGGGGGGNPIP